MLPRFFADIHIPVARSFGFCVMFCRSLFVPLFFSFSNCTCVIYNCVSFFDLRLLITPFVSSNFSMYYCCAGNSKYEGRNGSVFEIDRFGCQGKQAFLFLLCFVCFFACQFWKLALFLSTPTVWPSPTLYCLLLNLDSLLCNRCFAISYV